MNRLEAIGNITAIPSVLPSSMSPEQEAMSIFNTVQAIGTELSISAFRYPPRLVFRGKDISTRQRDLDVKMAVGHVTFRIRLECLSAIRKAQEEQTEELTQTEQGLIAREIAGSFAICLREQYASRIAPKNKKAFRELTLTALRIGASFDQNQDSLTKTIALMEENINSRVAFFAHFRDYAYPPKK
ncbi:hypothetical protein M1307_03895 [Patescibacteria group bacterium]|nr:hypothetical protein [Patescibacteria group bacterium]